MHELQEYNNTLANFDAAPYLDALEAVLKNHSPFQIDPLGSLQIRASALFDQIRLSMKPEQVEVIHPAAGGGKITACTTNMPLVERDSQNEQLRRIDERIEQHLNALAKENHVSVEQLVRARLGSPATSFPVVEMAQSITDELSTHATVDRKRYSYRNTSSNSDQAHLRSHLATLEITLPQDITQQLVLAITNRFRSEWPQLLEGQQQQIGAIVQEQAGRARSDMQRLVGIIEKEMLGQLKQEAALQFMTFLIQQMTALAGPVDRTMQQGRTMLVTIERRLRLLQAYLARDLPDDAFEVAFRSVGYNLRELFSASNAFADLPIYPIIDGVVQESNDREHAQGARINIFGAKMKLNGKVARYQANSSFEYHLRLLQMPPEKTDDDTAMLNGPRYNPKHLVRLAVLYHVVFTNFTDPTYDPIAGLENDLLAALDVADAQGPHASTRVLSDLANRLAKEITFAPLQRSILTTLRRLTPHTPHHATVYLTIQPGILQTDWRALLREKQLFRDPLAPDLKNYLAYFQVMQTIPTDAIFALKATINIQDRLVYNLPEQQIHHFDVQYDVIPKKILPCYFEIVERDTQGKAILASTEQGYPQGIRVPFAILQQRRATIYKDRRQQRPWFASRYFFTVIGYLCLRQLARQIPANTFISLAHLHDRGIVAGQPEDLDRFLAMLAKTTAQILGQEFLCNAQGLDVSSDTKYKGRNTAASLFTPLAKRFTFPQAVPTAIPRLALMVVSSRMCDGIADDREQRKSTVYGEITTFVPDGKVARVERRSTFNDNYYVKDLYAHPNIIVDQVEHLYRDQFHHILYVAQSPHSSSVHLTRSIQEAAEEDFTREGLFFHSRQIIEQCVQQKPDLHFYPIFRDMFSAMKLRNVNLSANSLFIPDTRDLLPTAADHPDIPQMMAFLQLFSGLPPVSSRGTSEHDKYNGVVSYATLLNIYGSALHDQNIRTDLIYDRDGASPIKNLIVLYLMLYHWSHYEVKIWNKRERQYTLGMKIDPYSDIIGDESVGKLATQQHASVGISFNFLALLTDVRKAVAVRTPLMKGGQA